MSTRDSLSVSAPAVFQRAMDTILQGIPHVICYIDDIVVTKESEEEHLRNLDQISTYSIAWQC